MTSSDITYTRYSFTLSCLLWNDIPEIQFGFQPRKIYTLFLLLFTNLCTLQMKKKNKQKIMTPRFLKSISYTWVWSMIILLLFTFAFRTDFLTILQRCHILYQTCIHNTCWWYTRNLCSCFQMQRCQVSPNCLNILAHYQYYTFLWLCIAVHWPYLDQFCHIHTNLKPTFHLRSNMYNIWNQTSVNLPQQQIVVIPRFFSLFGYGHFGCKEI